MVWCCTVWCVCWVRTRSGLRIRCRWAMDTATKHRIFNPVFQKESRRPTAKKRLSLYFWAISFKIPRNVRNKKKVGHLSFSLKTPKNGKHGQSYPIFFSGVSILFKEEIWGDGTWNLGPKLNCPFWKLFSLQRNKHYTKREINVYWSEHLKNFEMWR